jgi:hypothetical protein
MGCSFVQINEAYKPVFLIFKRDLLRRKAGDPTGLPRECVPISYSLSHRKTLHGEKRCPRFYFFPCHLFHQHGQDLCRRKLHGEKRCPRFYFFPCHLLGQSTWTGSVSEEVTWRKAMSTLLLLSLSPHRASSIGQICVGDVRSKHQLQRSRSRLAQSRGRSSYFFLGAHQHRDRINKQKGSPFAAGGPIRSTVTLLKLRI